MFLDFYQLSEQPFGVTPDPKFLYLGKSHREALATLFYGIEADRGFMVLIAPPGFGKTTLLYQLVDKIAPNARTVFLFQTQCNSRELMQYLLSDLGVDCEGMETVSMHKKLKDILFQEWQAGRRFVLIVDEAHNLDPAVLETIRLLSNIETSHSKLLQILLVGQPQLARKLASPGLDQLQQRISMFARLDPLDAHDTSRFIAHRLQMAGYTGRGLFTPACLELIAQQSQGVPRNINRLCFNALSLGYALGRTTIDADIVREVISDLRLEAPDKQAASSPAIVPHEINSRDTSAVPVLSYASEPEGRGSKRLTGIGAIAAVLAVTAALLVHFHVSPFYLAPHKPQSQTVSRTAISSKPSTASIAPPETKAAEPALPEPTPDTASLAGDTQRVVVRPGETLQQIALRALGQDDVQSIKLIQLLNPRIKNPDHIEANQEILLPQIPKSSALNTAEDSNTRRN